MIGMKLIACSILVGITFSKPVENEADYHQYQTSSGSSYVSPGMSAGYVGTQGTFSGYPAGYAFPQPIQASPLSSYISPFGFQGFGGNFGIPGYGGFPNFFG